MNIQTRSLAVAVFAVMAAASGHSDAAQERAPAAASQIDQRSYRLGGIDSFGEIVSVGIKKMALSAAMSPQDMDGLIDEARRIAASNKVELYREADFLVTDLFPASVTQGKHVLIIYRGNTKDEYLALKKRKAELMAAGTYTGKAREEIARKLGRLLSYPEAKIDEMLKSRSQL